MIYVMAGTKDPSNPFVEWLIKRLNKKGWTREELSRRSGVDSGSIANIINRKTDLGPDVARKIAKPLEVSQVFIFRLAGLIDEELIDEEAEAWQEIRRILSTMPPNRHEEAIRWLEAYSHMEESERSNPTVAHPRKAKGAAP